MSPQNLQEELLEGEILIYVRDDSAKGIWQARFDNPLSKSPRYIRASTKTASKALATERAISLYREYQSRAFLGLKEGTITIEMLIAKFGNEFKTTCREVIDLCHKLYWSQYMQEQDLSRWNTSDIEAYFKWRIKEQLSRPRGRYHKASDDSISSSTLMLERSYLKALFNHGYKNNIIARMPSFPRTFERFGKVHTLPHNQRRGRFDLETDYRQVLMPDFKRIRTGLNKKEWKPRLQNQDAPFDADSNKWISATRYNHQLGKDTKSKNFTRKTSRLSNAMFWFASLLIANTGIRPAEIVKLRHRDIKLIKDDDGAMYSVVYISEEVSKINMARHAISHDFEATYQRYLEYRRELNFYFNREIKDGDWLFPKYGLNTSGLYDNRVSGLHNLFRPHLQRLGLHKKESPTHKGVYIFYSAYSFRSFYITQRLAAHLSIYTIAKNVGASIETIMRSYDINETWVFRNEMTQHLKNWATNSPDKEAIEELERYAVAW
jgi:hypothetical protein